MTKLWSIIFIIALCTSESFGQSTTCDSLYVVVDQMPVYGNGNEDILKYLREKLKFSHPCRPEELKRLTWTINKDGAMVDIDVIGLEGECKAATIQQLKAFPAWTPGRLKGEPVCVKMVLPIHIRSGY